MDIEFSESATEAATNGERNDGESLEDSQPTNSGCVGDQRSSKELPNAYDEISLLKEDKESSNNEKNGSIQDTNGNGDLTCADGQGHNDVILGHDLDSVTTNVNNGANFSPKKTQNAQLDSFLEEEEGILGLLFRRSTVRRSRNRPRRSQSAKIHRASHCEDLHTISGKIDNECARPSPEGSRRSLRKLFRRNESFYRAQRNSIRQMDEQNENTDTPATGNNSVTENENSSLPSILINEIPNSILSSESHLDTNENDRGELLNSRNGVRRSVRFTINRVGSSDGSQSNNSERTTISNPSSILRSMLPSPLGSRPSHEHTSDDHNLTASSSFSSENNLTNERQPLIVETDEDRSKRVGFWPHIPSSMLAAMTCTIGMGSICRFAFLSFQYGGGFILQFLMLTISFGFPMLSFFMTLGQYMGCGIMDMWKISPVFQGVGVASLVATTLIGIYGIVPVSWFFVYFRDSFITDGVTFKWGECMFPFGRFGDSCGNHTLKKPFRTTVPQYFHNRVLQRSIVHPFVNTFSELKFENVFNLAVVWLLVFICLSKGIKSYGKVVFAFALFPLIGFLIISVEILRQAQGGTEFILKMNTLMYEVFTSGSSWVVAAREVFFVWGLNGAVLMQITSHNKFRHNVKRDSSVIILITLTTLLVAAFLGCACFSIVYSHENGNIKYTPSSFEKEQSMHFLSKSSNSPPPIQYQWSNNLLLGEEMINPNSDLQQKSNYQVFRLVTELFPAAVVYLGARNISPFWSVLLYLTLISFGIAQQLAIWRCVIEGIIAIKPSVLKAWETTITFVSCFMGFALGLPFTTEIGVFVLYFMDFCVGSAWWIMIIYLTQILALFIVRGKPYSADDLTELMTRDNLSKKWLSNLIAFSWNVIVPIGLLVLSITSFQNGMYIRIFKWYDRRGYMYWPIWVRQLGTFIQILPLLTIPLFGIVQTCRYLAKDPPDLFDRLQMLYRPSMRTPPDGQQAIYSDVTGHSDGIENPAFSDDPPPKYTPPPSYNTATGLKLLKRLNSLRRSIRSLHSSNRQSSRRSDVEMAAAVLNNETSFSQGLTNPFFISPQDISSASTSSHTN